MRAIDLFAGAGGLTIGLIEAGIDVVAAVEWDHDAAETYRRNIGDHMIEADITTLDPDDLPACDLIAGGPPCQGFSYAGKRDPNDPRNRLWEHYLRIVEAKQPAFVLIENVPGIRRSIEHHGIINALTGLGYRVSHFHLCAADFGVPQKRYRIFYVANRLGIANPCPTPTHLEVASGQLPMGAQPWVTVRQALGIGGQMTHKYSVTDRIATDGRTSPWYDGDTEPARSISHEPHKLLDEPSLAIRSGAHGAPGYSPRHQSGHVPVLTGRADHGVLDLDAPSCTIKAGGIFDTSGHMGGATPPAIPNIPLDQPSPTIQGGGSETGGAEPIRHRLRGRASGDGDGSTFDEPAPTIPAGWSVDVVDPSIGQRTYTDHEGRSHTRPSNEAILRRLTPEECAILQDFPPGFTFTGTKTSKHRQIGNAVPRGLARALGAEILRAWNAANEGIDA